MPRHRCGVGSSARRSACIGAARVRRSAGSAVRLRHGMPRERSTSKPTAAPGLSARGQIGPKSRACHTLPTLGRGGWGRGWGLAMQSAGPAGGWWCRRPAAAGAARAPCSVPRCSRCANSPGCLQARCTCMKACAAPGTRRPAATASGAPWRSGALGRLAAGRCGWLTGGGTSSASHRRRSAVDRRVVPGPSPLALPAPAPPQVPHLDRRAFGRQRSGHRQAAGRGVWAPLERGAAQRHVPRRAGELRRCALRWLAPRSTMCVGAMSCA